MDVSHGIGVTNRFDIFCNDDVDPYEILRQQDEEKQKRKLEKTQTKEKVKTEKPTKSIVTTASEKKPIENSADVGEVPNKPRGFKTTDRPPRNAGNYQNKETEKNSRNKDDNFFNPDQREGEYRRGRGGYRGRGGRDRGRGFFPNAEGRPRRVFDRHSGSDKTGVRPVDKRDGAGPHNWGDIRSEINQRSSENIWDEEFESGGNRSRGSANWGEDPNESGKFGEDAQKGDNETPLENQESKENDQNDGEQIQNIVKEMTLDEYKREIAAQKTVHKFNIRKPGEGEDEKRWKKSYVLKKKVPIEEEEQEEEDDDDDEVEEEECQRKGQQKILLDFQFNYTDSRRGMRGRGRGGRNGPRGGAGRDGGHRDVARDRGGRGREAPKSKNVQQAPRVDDFNDFPSLNNA